MPTLFDRAQAAIVALSVAMTALAAAIYLYALPDAAFALPLCILRCEAGDVRRTDVALALITLLAFTAIMTDLAARQIRGWLVILATFALAALMIGTIFGVILIPALFVITVMALWAAIGWNWTTLFWEQRGPSRMTLVIGLAIAAAMIPAAAHLFLFPRFEAAAKIAANGQPYCFAQPAPRSTTLIGMSRARDLSIGYMINQAFSRFASPYATLITPSGSRTWSFRKAAFVSDGISTGSHQFCPLTK